MIEFVWLWAFAFFPLPFLVRWLLPSRNDQPEAALRVPFYDQLAGHSADMKRSGFKQWPFWLGVLAWLCLVTAAARPQWLGEAIELPVSGRDLMLAVDLSGSMEAEDFKVRGRTVNRLVATKWVAGQFIQRRVGDRIGLILFGRQAYLQTPLTFDRETVKTLLHEAVIGLAGKETAIGDAIGLAVKRLKDKDVSSRVLILLTDGANTAGEVDPVKAAELAAQQKLKIYTIGIGADEMIVQSFFGRQRVNPSADLDETTLKAIAEKTGGRYFRARDTEELNKIYHLLDKLEPLEKEAQTFRPTTALFFWPLAIALCLTGLLSLARLNGHTMQSEGVSHG
ncbi:MAG: VWA domain-containing protein [Gammaproteobacteria bacterium]|nr:VWA domain-containing protein [Gammaproteobacteria bacterium]